MDEHPSIDVPGDDADLVTSMPPSEYEPVEEWVLSSTEDLSALRAGLMGTLERHGAKSTGRLSSTPDKLVLIASELATNALRHGLPPTIVRLARHHERFLLEVADHNTSTEPVYAGRRIPGAGGVGLHMARQLSLDVGWYRTDDVKTVWATFTA